MSVGNGGSVLLYAMGKSTALIKKIVTRCSNVRPQGSFLPAQACRGHFRSPT